MSLRRLLDVVTSSIQVHEPLRDLITTCTAFTQQLQSVLDCLGRRKKTVQSAVTLVAAVAEVSNSGIYMVYYTSYIPLLCVVESHRQSCSGACGSSSYGNIC